MGILIDSSVIILAERGKLDWSQLLSRHQGEPLAVSAITAAELLHGVHRADSTRRPKREAFVEAVLSAIDVLHFDLQAARVHGEVAAILSASGQPVGDHDLIIAATAIAYQYRVLTADLRSFPRVPRLDYITP